MNGTEGPEFQPVAPRARGVVVWSWLALVAACLGVLVAILRLSLLADFVLGQTDPAVFHPSDAMTTAVVALQFTVQAITSIAFLIWTYGAYRNLQPLNARPPRYTPGWAIGGFFVPFLNLFRVPQVMGELWRESQPPAAPTVGVMGNPAADARSVDTQRVSWWYALCILSSFCARASLQDATGAADPMGTVAMTTWFSLASDALDIPRALLAIDIVRSVTRWQTDRHAQWALSSEPLPDPRQYPVA